MAEKKSAAKAQAFDDESYYVISLKRATEYPPGSGRVIPVGARITMKGRAAKIIEADIADAKPVTVTT